MAAAAGSRGAGPDGVLLLDKPPGFSSTQALARAKRALGSRKAGHTGTLDPFATGLLPLVFGEATKFSRFLIDATKSYVATLKLGAETASGDTETPEIRHAPVACTAAAVQAALVRFVGWQEQVPPMHSAVHSGGKRLYELAREGVEVEREPRRIEILSLRLLELQGDRLVVDVTCSKGTYIRTLAMDIGRALGCGAYLTALRRTAVGPLPLEAAIPLADLQAAGPEAARGRLLPLETLVAGLPRWEPDARDAWRFSQGQVVDGPPGAPDGAEWAVFAPGGGFVGVGRCLRGGLAPLRLLSPQAMEMA